MKLRLTLPGGGDFGFMIDIEAPTYPKEGEIVSYDPPGTVYRDSGWEVEEGTERRVKTVVHALGSSDYDVYVVLKRDAFDTRLKFPHDLNPYTYPMI